MEINKEQVKRLIDVLGLPKIEHILGKKEIANIMTDVIKPTIVYDENKIYIWLNSKSNHTKHNFYKLHCLTTVSQGVGTTEQFAFIDLSTSNCYAKGSGSVEEQLSYAGENLHTFDSLEEFMSWYHMYFLNL